MPEGVFNGSSATYTAASHTRFHGNPSTPASLTSPWNNSPLVEKTAGGVWNWVNHHWFEKSEEPKSSLNARVILPNVNNSNLDQGPVFSAKVSG